MRAAWCLLFLVGAWLLGAVWVDPTGHFVGQPFVDAYGTVWTWWWAGLALVRGEGWARTDLLFHPWGTPVFLHTGGNLLDALLSWPLRAGLGAVLGYNLWIAGILASNGWVGSHVARAVGAGPWGRWLGAAFGVLQPFALHELNLGRPTQAMLLFLGLWIASLLRPASVMEGVRGGIALLFCGLGYWYYGLLGVWIGGVLGLVRLIRGDDRRQELLRLAVAGGIAGLGVLPLVWPLLEALGQGEVPGLLALQPSEGPLGRLSLQTVEGDTQALVVMSLDGRIGGLLDSDGLRFDPGIRQIHMVHVLALGASCVAAWRHAELRRSTGHLGMLLLAALWVAVGPVVVWGTEGLPNWPYQWAAEHLSVLRRWWWPARALGVVHLAIGAMAGLALSRVPMRARPWCALGTAGWVLLSLVSGGRVPLDSWAASRSPLLTCLRDAPDGAVVVLPHGRDQKDLYLQTIHHKPTLGGMNITKASFVPGEHRAFREENGLVRHLLEIGSGRNVSIQVDDITDADRQGLLGQGYRYLLVDKESIVRPRIGGQGGVEWVSDWNRLERRLRPLVGSPDFQDDAFALYALDGHALECLP